MTATKRVTVCLFLGTEWYWADRLRMYLRKHGLDAKLVSRHSVQVLPREEGEARKLVEDFRSQIAMESEIDARQCSQSGETRSG